MEVAYIDFLSLLKQNMERESGKDARKNNLAEALELKRLVETSFGPKGLKKMIDGAVVDKGSRILKAYGGKHPVQKMIVDSASQVEKEIGDATTASVLLTSFLLEEAKELIEQGVNPSAIISGYAKASGWAMEDLEGIAADADPTDMELVRDILKTSFGEKNDLGDDTLDVLSSLFLLKGEDFDPELIRVSTEKSHDKVGTRFVLGCRVDASPDTELERIDNPSILLVKGDLKPRKTKLDVEFRLENVESVRSAVKAEDSAMDHLSERIRSTGASLVLTTGEVDDRILQRMDREGIVMVPKVPEEELKRVSKAVGAPMLDPNDIERGYTVKVDAVVFESDDGCVGGVCGA